MQRYGFLTSIFAVLGSLLLSTTPSSGGSSTDNFIDQIATLKLAGKITEEEAIGHLQELIALSKRELANFRPPESKIVDDLFAHPRIEIELHCACVSDTVDGPYLVKIIRREGQLEIRIGEGKAQKTHKIDLGDRSEAERWAEVFDALQDLAKKIMVAPPTDSWLAEADAARLLEERIRKIPHRIASSTAVASIKIRANWTTLTLGGTEPPRYSDLYEWQDKITKMVIVKVAPPSKNEH